MTRIAIDHTHDASARSWVESANAADQDFPIQNLPLCIFRPEGEARARGGAAIGDRLLDLAGLAESGLLSGDAQAAAEAASGDALNPLMALGSRASTALRHQLFGLLEDGASPDVRQKVWPLLHAASRSSFTLPARIGNFTDFLTSIYHCERGGRVLRPESPVPECFHSLPVCYNSRASCLTVDARMRRPNGQSKRADGLVRYDPTQSLDFELEFGAYFGAGTTLGERLALDDALDRIFGYGLVNDWSARDFQRWESVLGPVLGKSFQTSVSPVVVTAQALAPFREAAPARLDDAPPLLPHLQSERNASEGGLDIELEAYLSSAAMRERGIAPARVTRTNVNHLYWTIGQMFTHFASNGCPILPGDLAATGTVSGPTPETMACMSELTLRGVEPISLPGGEQRTWLEDGDEVRFRATAAKPGFVSIGFGECIGRVEPALAD
jgi:fumarylacetoacetase